MKPRRLTPTRFAAKLATARTSQAAAEWLAPTVRLIARHTGQVPTMPTALAIARAIGVNHRLDAALTRVMRKAADPRPAPVLQGRLIHSSLAHQEPPAPYALPVPTRAPS